MLSNEFWLWFILIMVGRIGFASVADAHEWYDPACCDERDCRPIDAEHVTITPQGYRVEVGTLKAVVPFNEVRPSQDAGYHVCTYQLRRPQMGPSEFNEKIRRIKDRACLYVPLGY